MRTFCAIFKHCDENVLHRSSVLLGRKIQNSWVLLQCDRTMIISIAASYWVG